MAVNVVQSSLQLTTTLKVTGVSNAFDVRPRKIEQEFAGLWKLSFEIPGSRSKPTESHLRIYVGPSWNSKADYRHLGLITVSLSLESLEGEPQKKHSYEWDMSTDSSLTEEKWINLITWSALWTDNQDIRRDDGFCISVSLSSVPPPTRPVVTNPVILNNMLELMDGQDIIDTKFIVFSDRRVIDGVVCEPLPVYANSQLLQSQSEYFDNLLGNSTFSESQLEDFDQPPALSFITCYDDDSDSDLGYYSGEEVEVDGGDDLLETGPASALESRSARSVSRPRSSWTSLSDDSLPTIDQPVGKELESTLIDNESEEELWSSSRLHRKHCRHHNRFGKVVVITDCAYVTWKALIFYLCTSQISFAPLSVSKAPRSRSLAERSQGLPSRPSAKSIYRAADKLGLSDLAALALDHIKSQLTKDIVIHELFSKFTSRFDAVRDAELQFVFDHWNELKMSSELQEMLDRVGNGEMPHATKILATLIAH